MITHIGGQKPYYSVLYSSGRSHSNFLNIQLCRFEKLWRPNLFWTWKEFPPWNFNRLRRSRNWKWLELFYLSVLCLFVCFYLRSLKNVQCYLHFLNKESVVWMKTYNFFLPICNGKGRMGSELSFFSVQSHQRRDVIAFCLYLMKKSDGLSLSSLFGRF